MLYTGNLESGLNLQSNVGNLKIKKKGNNYYTIINDDCHVSHVNEFPEYQPTLRDLLRSKIAFDSSKTLDALAEKIRYKGKGSNSLALHEISLGLLFVKEIREMGLLTKQDFIKETRFECDIALRTIAASQGEVYEDSTYKRLKEIISDHQMSFSFPKEIQDLIASLEGSFSSYQEIACTM